MFELVNRKAGQATRCLGLCAARRERDIFRLLSRREDFEFVDARLGRVRGVNRHPHEACFRRSETFDENDSLSFRLWIKPQDFSLGGSKLFANRRCLTLPLVVIRCA